MFFSLSFSNLMISLDGRVDGRADLTAAIATAVSTSADTGVLASTADTRRTSTKVPPSLTAATSSAQVRENRARGVEGRGSGGSRGRGGGELSKGRDRGQGGGEEHSRGGGDGGKGIDGIGGGGGGDCGGGGGRGVKREGGRGGKREGGSGERVSFMSMQDLYATLPHTPPNPSSQLLPLPPTPPPCFATSSNFLHRPAVNSGKSGDANTHVGQRELHDDCHSQSVDSTRQVSSSLPEQSKRTKIDLPAANRMIKHSLGQGTGRNKN